MLCPKILRRISCPISVLAIFASSPVHTTPSTVVPSAIYQDPPADVAFPASGHGIRIASHGQWMNAMLYLPNGQGPHPTVVVMHGFPGNEQNLDLAQALRRDGWAVIAFHYRGSWGSEGIFSFDNAEQDGEAVIAWLQDPKNAKTWGIDPQRTVALGHSMGGYVVASVCAAHPEIRGCILIAPWDLSSDAKVLARMSAAEKDRFAATELNDVEGRVNAATSRGFVDILANSGQRWRLDQFAPELAAHSVLVVVATRDGDSDKALVLVPALKAHHATRLRVETVDTDHGFNDHRIALETIVVKWLASLRNTAGFRSK